MVAPIPIMPFADLAKSIFIEMFIWSIPIIVLLAIVRGLVEKWEKDTYRKERIREQIEYEEALMRERKLRGFEPELGEMPSEKAEYCPTCGKRR